MKNLIFYLKAVKTVQTGSYKAEVRASSGAKNK
jgi:hypothetical protein